MGGSQLAWAAELDHRRCGVIGGLGDFQQRERSAGRAGHAVRRRLLGHTRVMSSSARCLSLARSTTHCSPALLSSVCEFAAAPADSDVAELAHRAVELRKPGVSAAPASTSLERTTHTRTTRMTVSGGLAGVGRSPAQRCRLLHRSAGRRRTRPPHRCRGGSGSTIRGRTAGTAIGPAADGSQCSRGHRYPHRTLAKRSGSKATAAVRPVVRVMSQWSEPAASKPSPIVEREIGRLWARRRRVALNPERRLRKRLRCGPQAVVFQTQDCCMARFEHQVSHRCRRSGGVRVGVVVGYRNGLLEVVGFVDHRCCR